MEIKEGDIYICRVKKLLQHGIIVTIGNEEKEGFIHISELSKRWVRDVKDIAKEGDTLVCKVITLGQSPELSIKRVTDSE
ncbi:MAG: translation initiation factor IF-2 subunit alpha [Candidatus Parvarchaeum acidiphilum ARMAN-4]|uniref:Translation initiation factor IF-2 subunit alpha n=1 Tax=Candidatus Parvarchaeum acidiphilum ARMAN-4 TaxID=662760 RepID=D2EE74_PARA4|nr:MAG: translation initiation factor IF-2 subunit alpha [Candidatus Parvarchaeum acidiphilum ARMAN-4]